MDEINREIQDHQKSVGVMVLNHFKEKINGNFYFDT